MDGWRWVYRELGRIYSSLIRKMRELLGDILLIACGIALGFIFITIKILGRFWVEPNSWILWAEIIMSACIIILGIDRLRDDL